MAGPMRNQATHSNTESKAMDNKNRPAAKRRVESASTSRPPRRSTVQPMDGPGSAASSVRAPAPLDEGLTPARAVQDVTAHRPRLVLFGPAALGRMSKSKMAVGRYSVQQALGMSTIPLIRPSIGAEPSKR